MTGAGSQERRTRRRRAAVAVVVLAALVLGGLGAAAGAWRAQGSTAEAVVLVAPLEGNPFSPEGQGEELVNLESEAQLVRSESVATLVARGLADPVAVDDLLRGVTVEVPVNTQILQIGYQAATPAVAAERAQAFATRFLAYRQQRAESLIAGRRERVASQIEAESRRLSRVVGQLPDAGSPAERTLLQGRADAGAAQIAALRGQLAELSVGSLDPGQIVTPATADDAGAGPPLALLGGAAGALLGLLAGTALVLARGWSAGGLRRADDATGLGVPVVGEVDAADLEQGPDAEQVRRLRSAVLGRLVPGDQGSSVLVTRVGAEVDDHPSGLADVLARAAAQSQVPTLLVRTRAFAPAGGAARAGLAEVLRGHRRLDAVLVAESEHLEVLDVGQEVGALDDLVVSPTMRRVLAECARRADLVVVDAAALGGPGGRALVEMVDALLLEVRPGDPTEEVETAAALGAAARTAWTRAVWVDSVPAHAAPTAAPTTPPTAAPTREETPASARVAPEAPAASPPPAADQPAAKAQASKGPAAKAPAAKEPASKGPAAKEPAAKEPATRKQAAPAPARPTAEKRPPRQSLAQQASARQAAAKQAADRPERSGRTTRPSQPGS